MELIKAEDELLRICPSQFGLCNVYISSDGKRITTSSNDVDRVVRTWDAETGQLLRCYYGKIVNFNKEKEIYYVYDAPNRNITALNEKTGEYIRSIVYDGFYFRALLAVSPDERKILAANYNTWALDVLDSSTGEILFHLVGHTSYITKGIFSHDGRRIVTTNHDKTARIWDAETGRRLHILKDHQDWVEDAAFSSDGRWVVTGCYDDFTRVWNTETGELIRKIKLSSSSIAFGLNNRRVVSGCSFFNERGFLSSNSVCVWDFDSGEIIHTFKGHTNMVSSVTFSPDGKKIISASYDNSVRVWDFEKYDLYWSVENHFRFPKKFQKLIKIFLLGLNRLQKKSLPRVDPTLLEMDFFPKLSMGMV